MNDQDSVQRLAEIRERTDKATPGLWEAYRAGGGDGHGFGVSETHVGCITCQVAREDDADFIAHSREDVPYLLSVIDSLTAERDELARLNEMLNGKWMEQAVRATKADSRAEAAEADRERLREALELIAGGESLDAAGCARIARAALATPPVRNAKES